MRMTVKKLFWAWDFEKEEKWLNEMSAKGLTLVAVVLCSYIFEDGIPGEYTIRIEYLNNWPSHIESQQYIRFIEETGAEHICSVNKWVYFRKKAELGSFDLYSDIDSRIKHLNRILLLISIVACANIPNFFIILRMAVISDNLFLKVVSVIFLSLEVLMIIGSAKLFKMKKKLQKEKKLFE